MPFLPMTEKNRREMLQTIGIAEFEELLAPIPGALRFKGKLNLPEPLSEFEVARHLSELASQNEHAGTFACFLGGGAYDHFIPAAVGHVLMRPEFYTSYTPYQPEVSQGTLQAIYEYQTMIAELTGMDAANASLYDGASALAEAALLLNGQTGRSTLLVSKTVHPFYRKVVSTYCHRAGISLKEIPAKDGVTDVEQLRRAAGADTAGALVQHPNFFGFLEDTEAIGNAVHSAGGLFAVSVDPISLGLLKPPGEYGADVATGEGQALGNPLSFGGPYVGLFAVKKDLLRRLPGRLVGVTRDKKGRRGFVLTLQTREQHIRREKATSSICTNEQLCALASTVYMALMGKTGLPQVAELCLRKAHYLAREITKLKGFSLLSSRSFFKEFAVKCPIPPARIIEALHRERLFAGIDLSRFDYGLEDSLLVAVTEKRTKAEMDRYVQALKNLLKS
jgi:glycine dehydrogenase subunit 1